MVASREGFSLVTNIPDKTLERLNALNPKVQTFRKLDEILHPCFSSPSFPRIGKHLPTEPFLLSGLFASHCVRNWLKFQQGDAACVYHGFCLRIRLLICVMGQPVCTNSVCCTWQVLLFYLKCIYLTKIEALRYTFIQIKSIKKSKTISIYLILVIDNIYRIKTFKREVK